MEQAKQESPNSKPSVATKLCLILLAYFAVQFTLRLLISDSTDLDESEQLLLTQQPHWGYGPQPPLYTWIQIGFFKLFGVSIFSLAVFKNLLLCGIFSLTYANSRMATTSTPCALASAASLFFIPQIAWESQRDLTHSVLASTLVLATWSCILRIRSKPQTISYVALGFAIGLGFLSKYNYAVFLLALIPSLLSLKAFRPLVLSPNMLVAGVIALLVITPNVLWITHHRTMALSAASKFAINHSGNAISDAFSGLCSLFKSTVTFLGPLVLIFAVIFHSRSRAQPLVRTPFTHLMLRNVILSFALIVAGVVISCATDIRDRWLQPIFIYSPVLMIAALQSRLDSRHLKRILISAGIVMTMMPILLAGRIVFAEELHRKQPFNEPYKQLAEKARASLRNVSVVVADTKLLGGNLRLTIPDKVIVTPELAPLFAPEQARFGFVWNATKEVELPQELIEFAARKGITLTNTAPEYFAAHYKYRDSRQMRIGVLVPE